MRRSWRSDVLPWFLPPGDKPLDDHAKQQPPSVHYRCDRKHKDEIRKTFQINKHERESHDET
jgi:hypothetical protein